MVLILKLELFNDMFQKLLTSHKSHSENFLHIFSVIRLTAQYKLPLTTSSIYLLTSKIEVLDFSPLYTMYSNYQNMQLYIVQITFYILSYCILYLEYILFKTNIVYFLPYKQIFC